MVWDTQPQLQTNFSSPLAGDEQIFKSNFEIELNILVNIFTV